MTRQATALSGLLTFANQYLRDSKGSGEMCKVRFAHTDVPPSEPIGCPLWSYTAQHGIRQDEPYSKQLVDAPFVLSLLFIHALPTDILGSDLPK